MNIIVTSTVVRCVVVYRCYSTHVPIIQNTQALLKNNWCPLKHNPKKINGLAIFNIYSVSE